MDKPKVFAEAHSDMKKIIEGLTLENLAETENSLTSYFSFLKQLTTLPQISTQYIQKEIIGTSPTSLPAVTEENENKDEQEPLYFLERKLRGGFLVHPENETLNIFIQEGKIRKYGFDHADLIRAIPQGERHSFELVKKQDSLKHLSNRIQLDYCVLTKRDSIWLCESQYINGTEKWIKLDEAPYSFIIPDDDVKEANLAEGSIIDLAYYASQPNRVKIVYVHDSEIIEYQAPQPSGHYKKEKEKEITPNSVEVDDLTDFQNKTILVVGLEARKSKFQQEIEIRGGRMLWASGNEEKSRLEAMVKKVDMAVVIIQHTSHRGSIQTAQLCKKHNVKFCSTRSRGVDSLLTAIINSVEELDYIS